MKAHLVVRIAPGSLAFVLALGALSALPPLSIDASLPAFPATARELAVAPGALQATLGGFLLAFALGQLVWGPLCDRFGRRRTMIAGLAVYALAGAVCALVSDVVPLLAARCAQGFGACATAVAVRAVVRDTAANRDDAAAMQGYVGAAMSVAPVVAPLLGAGVLALLGWRAVYAMLAAAGVALIALPLFALAETAPAGARGHALGVADAYARFLSLPRSVPLTAALAAAFAGQFAFIGGSPFVLIDEYHLTPAAYAVAFALASAAVIAGSLLGGIVARRSRALPERMTAAAAYGLLAVGLVTLLAARLAPGPAAFVATMALYSLGAGVLIPNLYAAGMDAAAGFAGVAAAVLGAAQMAGGAAGSTLVGAFPLPPAEGVGLVAAAAGVLVAGAYAASRVQLRRSGRRTDTEQPRSSTETDGVDASRSIK